MLDRKEYMPLAYIRMQRFTGSYEGMRFMLHKVTEILEEKTEEKEAVTENYLEAVIWPEPYSYEVTEEEKKTRKRFGLSEEGREEAIQWLEESYDARKEEWVKSR